MAPAERQRQAQFLTARSAFACIALVCAGAFAGPDRFLVSQTATGSIAGRVLDAASGQPVSGAVVRIDALISAVDLSGNTLDVILAPSMSRGATQSPIRTSSDGVFAFSDVRPGTFVIRVERTGYLPAAYGKRRWDAQAAPVVLSPGQNIGDLAVLLWKPGVVSGSARDEIGDVLVGVQVRALRLEPVGGRYRFCDAGSVLTDDQGHYRFDSLSPGKYLLAGMASVVTIPKTIVQAYRDARGGQATAASAAISKSGAPVPSSNSAATLESVGVLEWRGPAGTLQTGAAPDSPPQVAVYQTTFYPGASDPATGLLVDVEPGVVQTNIDLGFRLSHSFQITGTLRAPGGEAVAHAGLRLVSSGMDALASDRGFETAITATDENGRFLMLGVPPGRYALQAAIGTNVWVPPVNSPEALLTMTIDSAGRLSAPLRPASDELFWARETLNVGDTDVRDVVLDLHTGIRLSGRVEFDGASPRPTTSAVPMLLEIVDKVREGAAASNRPDADWHFQTAPYPPGRYRVIVGIGDERWRLRSIVIGGRDVAFGSVDLGMGDISNVVVTLEDRKRGRVSGQVQFAPGTPRSDLPVRITVVAFPADFEGWIAAGMHPGRTQTAMTKLTEPFSLGNLPPGDYLVAAVADNQSADLRDPALVRAIAPASARVHVDPGDSKTIVVQLSRVPRS